MLGPEGVKVGNVDHVGGAMVCDRAVSSSHATICIILDVRIDGSAVTTVCAREPRDTRGLIGRTWS